ncbi:hypothetical protein [Pelosinus sp. sgz500959]
MKDGRRPVVIDITFLVRKKRAEQLREHGLVIQSPAGNVMSQVTVL